MNQLQAMRWLAALSPGVLALGVVLEPIRGYELQESLLVVLSLALFLCALLARSDGLHITSLASLAFLLLLGVSQESYVYSFATVVLLLVGLDFVGLVHSMFGLTQRREDLLVSGAASKYLEIMTEHLVRSLTVGVSALLLSLAMVSVPIPQLVFGNPVSGTGILALATLLLILLAFTSFDQVKGWFWGRRTNPAKRG